MTRHPVGGDGLPAQELAKEAPTFSQYGNFTGRALWNTPLLLPESRVLFVPKCARSILIFHLGDYSFEALGHFPGEDKWSGGLMLPDGRVLFVPSCFPSLLVFQPSDGTWQLIHHSEEEDKWASGIALRDGRVLLVPSCSPHILLFSPEDNTVVQLGCFEGVFKWAGAALLPDGRVLFVPSCATFMLIFSPDRGTWEELGDFTGRDQWSDCVVLRDARVVFVPHDSTSILLFRPADNSWEQLGHFKGQAKWSRGVLLPDGRVLFVPLCAESLLLFQPSSNTWDTLGCFMGRMKWSGGFVLPNGKVFLVPFNATSVLLFCPRSKTWCDVGDFDGGCKWCGGLVLPDGKAVLAPCSGRYCLVAEHSEWHERAQQRMRHAHANTASPHTWQDWDAADVVVQAGADSKSRRAIPAHRAVLAAQSTTFAELFTGAPCLEHPARVSVREEASVVEAVLKHAHTGVLPQLARAELLQVMHLAHRLGFKGCVLASADATGNAGPAEALQAFAPLLSDPFVSASWSLLKCRLRNDPLLFDAVMRILACPRAGAAVPCTCPADEAPMPELLLQSEEGDEAEHRSDSDVFDERGVMCEILHFSRSLGPRLIGALKQSELGRRILERGGELRPDWARGAVVLVEDLDVQALLELGVAPLDLRPWHALVRSQDAPLLLSLLLDIESYRRRPRVKEQFTRRFTLNHQSPPAASAR